MGRSIPITVGDVHFESKKAAKISIRARIAKYVFNEQLCDDDKAFFLDLFRHHSEHDKKVGCGIKNIEVRKDEQGNKYLHLIRIDGTDEDISWVHCISPKKEKTVIYEALRSSVKDQIQDFKEKEVEQDSCCPFYGTSLDFNNSHVDHFNPTFEILVSKFLNGRDHGLSSEDIIEQEGNDNRGVLKDEELLNAWRTFHSENASLRLISIKANLSNAKKS